MPQTAKVVSEGRGERAKQTPRRPLPLSQGGEQGARSCPRVRPVPKGPERVRLPCGQTPCPSEPPLKFLNSFRNQGKLILTVLRISQHDTALQNVQKLLQPTRTCSPGAMLAENSRGPSGPRKQAPAQSPLATTSSLLLRLRRLRRHPHTPTALRRAQPATSPAASSCPPRPSQPLTRHSTFQNLA